MGRVSQPLTPEVRSSLNQGCIDPVIVPGGCTKFIQAPDVTWNNPLKVARNDEWLADDNQQLTSQGNMKPPSR